MARSCTLIEKHSNQPETIVLVRSGITRCRAWMHSRKMELFREGYRITDFTDDSVTLETESSTITLTIMEGK